MELTKDDLLELIERYSIRRSSANLSLRCHRCNDAPSTNGLIQTLFSGTTLRDMVVMATKHEADVHAKG